jgi:hypothetical protein
VVAPVSDQSSCGGGSHGLVDRAVRVLGVRLEQPGAASQGVTVTVRSEVEV